MRPSVITSTYLATDAGFSRGNQSRDGHTTLADSHGEFIICGLLIIKR
jgi:hypothetical protein